MDEDTVALELCSETTLVEKSRSLGSATWPVIQPVDRPVTCLTDSLSIYLAEK